MSVRSHSMLLLAAATALSVAGCKQAPPPSESATPQPAAATAPQQIGGQDIVKLERKPTSGGQKPEFLSATVLPGRGMNVFQITANIPGKGEVDVFASPSLADAAAKLNGGPDDQNGNASFSFGGAFLVPYPNRIRGKLSADGKTIATEWKGKTITLPANWKGKNPGAEPHAMHGLILASKTDDVKTETTADGQTVTGTIHAGNFGGYWLSNTGSQFHDRSRRGCSGCDDHGEERGYRGRTHCHRVASLLQHSERRPQAGSAARSGRADGRGQQLRRCLPDGKAGSGEGNEVRLYFSGRESRSTIFSSTTTGRSFSARMGLSMSI